MGLIAHRRTTNTEQSQTFCEPVAWGVWRGMVPFGRECLGLKVNGLKNKAKGPAADALQQLVPLSQACWDCPTGAGCQGAPSSLPPRQFSKRKTVASAAQSASFDLPPPKHKDLQKWGVNHACSQRANTEGLCDFQDPWRKPQGGAPSTAVAKAGGLSTHGI